MTVVAEAIGNFQNTVGKGCHTGAVGYGIAGITGAADTYGFAQIVCLSLLACQTDIRNGNGVSVGGVAIGQLCIPGGAAEDADTDAGQLSVNQILFRIQLDCLLLACLENNLVGINLVGIALEVIGIEAHLNVVCPVTAQGIDLHIQLNIAALLFRTGLCFIGLCFTRLCFIGLCFIGLCFIGLCCRSQGNLVTVVAEAIGNLQNTVGKGCHAGAVGYGIAGITGAADTYRFA